MDAVEDYARKKIKREKEDIDSLSECIKAVRSLMLTFSFYENFKEVIECQCCNQFSKTPM